MQRHRTCRREFTGRIKRCLIGFLKSKLGEEALELLGLIT